MTGKMSFEFDHLFICTDVGAIAADRLGALGLLEGSANVHPGQGTANRRFFFHNAMVELLWVHDPEEAQSERIRRTHLGERWAQRNAGACPFGICLRSTDRASIAFPHWDFRPPYLPEELSIAVGENSAILTEPMVFQTPFGQRPDQFLGEKAQPLVHPIGWREITRVTLVSPVTDRPSDAWQAVLDTGQVQLEFGAEYCIELGFDDEVQGQRLDCRWSPTDRRSSALPLVFSW
jgi:Glyoxalase-like domain